MGLSEKVNTSIERIRRITPEMMGKGDAYFLAFSGGKDSVAVKALLDMAGVKYESHYRITSVDPPELIQFVKEKYPDVKRDKPFYKNELDAHGNPIQITMWNLIPKKLMPPTRLVRYCCASLKENSGDGRLTVTGVRRAESVKRAKNQGIITITDRNSSKNIEGNQNFYQTPAGGWC